MIERDAEGIAFCIGTPANTVRAFNDDDRFSVRDQGPGGGEAGGTSPDHNDIRIGG